MKVILTDEMTIFGAHYQLVPKGTVLKVQPFGFRNEWLAVKEGPYKELCLSKDSVCIRVEEDK